MSAALRRAWGCDSSCRPSALGPHTGLGWQVVCDFCRQHLAANREAYADPRLEVVNDDAAAQLEATEERFDVIVADLADPVDGGPCYQVQPCKPSLCMERS